jgi:acyl carrier protein
MSKTVLEILKLIRPDIEPNEETDLIQGGFLDSFDIIELVTELDEEYNISIDGADVSATNFTSIKSIEILLKKYLEDA